MNTIKNQHGDLLLQEISSIPDGATRIELTGPYVIERGEGIHTHVLTDIEGIEVYEKDGDTYVKVLRDPKITHEEHGYQPIKPGIYKKSIERVYDYETEETRKVID